MSRRAPRAAAATESAELAGLRHQLLAERRLLGGARVDARLRQNLAARIDCGRAVADGYDACDPAAAAAVAIRVDEAEHVALAWRADKGGGGGPRDGEGTYRGADE